MVKKCANWLQTARTENGEGRGGLATCMCNANEHINASFVVTVKYQIYLQQYVNIANKCHAAKPECSLACEQWRSQRGADGATEIIFECFCCWFDQLLVS